MIKELSSDISSDQLKEALGFCGNGISGFSFGSSSSVAYVEFEVRLLLTLVTLISYSASYYQMTTFSKGFQCFEPESPFSVV